MKKRKAYLLFGSAILVVLAGIVFFGTKQGSGQFAAIIRPTANVCDNIKTPYLRIISPNGGEVYQAGQKILIQWISCNFSTNENVTIELDIPQENSFIGYQLKLQTLNDGAELVTLPTKINWPLMVYGKNFKITVLKTQGFSPFDRSDNLFTIN